MFLSPYRDRDEMGFRAIPLSEIKNYSLLFDLIIPIDEFTMIIQQIDQIYLEDVRLRTEKPTGED